jgi:hypothetical protein
MAWIPFTKPGTTTDDFPNLGIDPYPIETIRSTDVDEEDQPLEFRQYVLPLRA